MPPAPKLRTPALRELISQLRFVPSPTARRHVERAEHLFTLIDPESTYPADWVIYQITAYRPDTSDTSEPVLIPGKALRGDLPALIDRLSMIAQFESAELHAQGWLDASEVAKRWSITPRTLQRYRSLGLLSRRARAPVKGGVRVLYHPQSLENFLAQNTPRLSEAAAFSRLSSDERERLLRLAQRCRERFAWSPTRIAHELAKHSGRSVEAMRQLLKAAPKANLASRAPLRPRDLRLIELASRRGFKTTQIARRLSRTPAAVSRAELQHLARRLRNAPLPEAPEGIIDVAAALKNPSVSMGLGAGCAATMSEHVRRTLDAGWPDAQLELARARALQALLSRARGTISQIDPTRPRLQTIDRVRTDLLWACRLKAELVRSQQMLLIKTIEGRLGNAGLESLPPRSARELFLLCIDALMTAVDRFDPYKGGRLAAPAGIELNRAVARWQQQQPQQSSQSPKPPQRLAERAHKPAVELVVLPDWTRRVYPFQTMLEPAEPVRRAVQDLSAPLSATDRTLLAARFGLLSEPPTTLKSLTTSMKNLPTNLLVRRERLAIRRAFLVGLKIATSPAAEPRV
ncbi:MAG: helix-turn-helix domain-containing protein [Phycisphaerales bacterium]|nr:helix-turn-helix domain-containing protein [Phycisphaerales bacterium]